MISQSARVSVIGARIGGTSAAKQAEGRRPPLTSLEGPSKLRPERRIVMTTTQKPTVNLTLTERAGEEVRKFLAEEQATPETAGLRVAVLPGGCSGFKYSLSVEPEPAAD